MICVLVSHCFVNSLAFASNILLADINSLSFKMFTMFRLSGAQVRSRWMAALILVNTLGVNAGAFCFHFSEELLQNCTHVRWTYCFEIHCNFSFLAPFIELFYSLLSCSRVFFAWAFCPISSSCSLSKPEFWLEKKLKIWDFFDFRIKSPNVNVHWRATKWTKANSSTKIRANSSVEIVSSGSHWPSEVVWHLWWPMRAIAKSPIVFLFLLFYLVFCTYSSF